MADLPKRTLGRTGLEVTTLGYGAMEIRGPRIWGGRPVSDKQAETILNAVLDAGINFIDTSNDYGRSEELIGRFISKRRDEYYIATKCGCKVTPAGDHDETPHEFTRENILRGIEESLSRLKIDYVDILQLHNPSVDVADAGNVEDVLSEIKESGKTRFISISSTVPHLPVFLKRGVFDTFQIPYSALQRVHEDWITQVAKADAGTIIRGGVAQGKLGKDPDRKGNKWDTWKEAKLDELLDGATPQEFMFRYTMTHPDLHTNIVGTLSPVHLAENIAVLQKGPLAADVYEEAKRRLTEAGEVVDRVG